MRTTERRVQGAYNLIFEEPDDGDPISGITIDGVAFLPRVGDTIEEWAPDGGEEGVNDFGCKRRFEVVRVVHSYSRVGSLREGLPLGPDVWVRRMDGKSPAGQAPTQDDTVAAFLSRHELSTRARKLIADVVQRFGVTNLHDLAVHVRASRSSTLPRGLGKGTVKEVDDALRGDGL